MKNIALLMVLLAVGSGAFAQAQGPGPKRGPGFEWKLGTVVTTEYKKLTGTIDVSTQGPPKFQAEGVEYHLRVPHEVLASVKTGDSITVEGTFTTVKSDAPVPAIARAFRVTINGKEIDVRGEGPHQGGPGPGPKGPQGGSAEGPAPDNPEEP